MDDRNGTRAVIVVIDRGRERVLGRLIDLHPDLALVDALARLQLAAGRLGCSIGVRDACPRLVELLDLAGLRSLAEPAEGSVELGGQAEGGEQLGVQEVVPPRDPSP